MPSEISKERFEAVDLDVIHVGNQRWLRGEDIGAALGFRDPADAVKKILQRSRSEFDETTTITVEMHTATGWRATRLYNARGAALIAMKAQTPKGEAFRRWVLDVLEGTADTGPVEPAQNIPAAVHKRLVGMFLGSRGNGALIRYRTLGLGGAEIAKLLSVSRVNVVERIRVAEFLGLVAVDPALEAYRLKPQFLKFQEARRAQHQKTAQKLKAQKALTGPTGETVNAQ